MIDASYQNKFTAAVLRMLRPVVRQLIAYGVPFSSFSRLLKALYVQVAEEEFPLPFKRQTDSRLALVTGMTRKEVSQLRQQRASEIGLPRVEHNLTMRVVSRWLAGPPYADPSGGPRLLPYEAPPSRSGSFSRLVRETGGAEIPVRSVLDELIRLDAVSLEKSGDVRLKSVGGLSAPDAESKLAVLAADPGELFRTIVHNIETPEDPRLQRKVVYDNIGAEAIPHIRKATRQLTEQFLRQANQLVASYDRDSNPDSPGGARSRVVLGVYYLDEEMQSARADATPAPPGRIRKPRRPRRSK